MVPAQLKETTMNPENRTLLRIQVPEEDKASTADCVSRLMGSKPEMRFKFIQENAVFADDNLLDI